MHDATFLDVGDLQRQLLQHFGVKFVLNQIIVGLHVLVNRKIDDEIAMAWQNAIPMLELTKLAIEEIICSL
jgi:hypothetical protein